MDGVERDINEKKVFVFLCFCVFIRFLQPVNMTYQRGRRGRSNRVSSCVLDGVVMEWRWSGEQNNELNNQ